MDDERKKALQSLKISKGQIEATIKMIEEDRYCIDISTQIMASQSLLKKANLLILKHHMNNCVLDAFEHDNRVEKLDEVMELLSKIIGK